MIHIQLKPLSINEAWRGRRTKTEKYKEYEWNCFTYLPKDYEVPEGKLVAMYEFGIATQADWDNPVKALQDILQKKYGFNDKDIMLAIVKKTVVKNGKGFFRFDFLPYDQFIDEAKEIMSSFVICPDHSP